MKLLCWASVVSTEWRRSVPPVTFFLLQVHLRDDQLLIDCNWSHSRIHLQWMMARLSGFSSVSSSELSDAINLGTRWALLTMQSCFISLSLSFSSFPHSLTYSLFSKLNNPMTTFVSLRYLFSLTLSLSVCHYFTIHPYAHRHLITLARVQHTSHFTWKRSTRTVSLLFLMIDCSRVFLINHAACPSHLITG